MLPEYNHCLKNYQTLLFLSLYLGDEHVKTNNYSSI
jgi:hypothetical protein